jgi:hypothetical protein
MIIELKPNVDASQQQLIIEKITDLGYKSIAVATQSILSGHWKEGI